MTPPSPARDQISWTGHQPAYFADPAAAEAVVNARAAALLAAQAGTLVFHCGGQRGVDTWAARAALRLGLPLRLVLPLPLATFAADWAPADRAVLEQTCAAATSVTVCAPADGDAEAAYRARNRLLAERCGLLIAVWTGLGGGGTAETIELARGLGRQIEEHRLLGSDRRPAAGERGV